MSVTPTDAAPELILRPQAVPPPREDVANEIWNLPNSLTLLRIFLVPFLVVVLLTKFSGREYAGLGIFLLAAITDFFDGYFARRMKKVTRLGALLDPIADKLLMSAAFISLVELGLARAWIVVIIIGREFAVSGLRSIAAQQGVTIAASPLGKGKTISQVIAISLLILGYELGDVIPVLGEVALWIVMVFALASGVDYFFKFARAVLRPDHKSSR
ncbi:MAG TPA: CDP-diacylglycerol--glycerol-3-phosphate 3-phosphatidyltransferase [Thermoanaerobaculia bacterium]|jgi:CDP-diacylglycerol--glycerol-3-phosphate 3-phosphatidyltransferase|nr:CDP-diacylglycerol--glycerol-3-phosphate 3-phosphatidyltransferase [Thermoanaerobaculia bacterium]